MVWGDGCFHSKLVGQERPHWKKKMMFEQRHEYERHWIWLHVSMLRVSIYHERVFHCILLAQEKFKIQNLKYSFYWMHIAFTFL